MPHLEASLEANKDDTASQGPRSTTEVREGVKKKEKEAANPLLSFASAATTQSMKESGGKPSVEEAQWRHPPPPRGAPAITPSPYYRAPYGLEPPYYGWTGHHSIHGTHGRGGRRLFPTSPVRHTKDTDDKEKRAKAKGGEERKDESSRRAAYEMLSSPGPPPYSAYGMPPPYHPYPPHYYDEHYARTALPSRKRQADSSDETSPKRTKVTGKADDEKKNPPKEEIDNAKDDDSNAESSQASAKKVSKKRVISPASSLDGMAQSKGEGRESPSVNHKSTRSVDNCPPGESRPPPYDPYYHHEAYTYGAARGHYPPYYAGYPPPPPYGEGPPPPPPHVWAGYHPHDPTLYHPPHYHPRGLEYRPRPPYSGSHPGSFERSTASPAPPAPPKATAEVSKPDKNTMEAPEASPETQPDAAASAEQGVEVLKKIESVADWQVSARATGLAPSAFRCVPLKEPIPSKCWGTLEHAETMTLPDFHRLVNYPDYLIKNYPNYLKKTKSTKNTIAGVQVDKNGKRHCVMCGELRLCSASSSQPTPSTRVRAPQTKKNELEVAEETGDDEESESETMHIIPRQNKGLCTACDITVWVIMDSNCDASRLEIKWCKGCKNFRPWAAFGDKGMATKCVRCRDRQRDKYASQKDKLRANRQTQKAAAKDGHHEIEAARGLRDLMAATL